MATARVHFRAGFATVDITPDPAEGRVELSGYVAREQPATGVRDRLRAGVLALGGEGCDPWLLVGLDLCILDAAAAGRLAAACPLPEERVVLCCSHTHAAPATYPLIGCGAPDPAYVRRAALAVGDAARRALADAVPCRVGWGRRALPSGALWGNRRDPAGPVDPRVHLMKIERSDSTRRPVCAVWSVACHPVVLGADNRAVSADWVGEVARALPFPSLFLQGFCGDQDPLRRGEAELGPWAALAAELGALWNVTPTAAAGPLGWARREVRLPRLPGDAVPPRPADPRAAAAMLRWADTVAAPGEPVPPEAAAVVACRIGAGRAAFWPGEPHAAFALALPSDCCGVGHAGPSVGYIPERQAYAGGGYEVAAAHRYYGFPSALAPEAGEALRAATDALLRELG